MAGILPHVFQDAVAATGNGTALKCEGYASVTVELTISATATVTFEGAGQLEKSDGTYFAIPALNLTTGVWATTATASGIYLVAIGGLNWARVRVSSRSSGTISAAGNATTIGPVRLIDTSSSSASAALSDAAANPTTTTVGADMMVWNNTAGQWERMRRGPDHDAVSTSSSVGLPGFVPVAIDQVNSLYRLARMASRDSENSGGVLASGPMMFNGTSFDRQRGNTDIALLGSSARTTTTIGTTVTNHNARGIIVWLNITVASGAGGLSVRVQGLDSSLSGNGGYINPAPTAIVATGLYGYLIYPGAGMTAVAGAGQINQVISAPIPRFISISVTHGDASSYTYSVGYDLIT